MAKVVPGDMFAQFAQHLASDQRDAVTGGSLAAGGAVKLYGLTGHAGGVEAVNLPYSFMIHAITWASVPTSGAGMSLSGPMKS